MFTATRFSLANAAAATAGALLFAGACLGAAAAPAHAAEAGVRTKQVFYGDLDLGTKAGQRKLAWRIRAAARDVCDQADNGTRTMIDESRCMVDAIAATRNQTMAAIAGSGRAG